MLTQFFLFEPKINCEKFYKITSKTKLMIVNIFPIKLYLLRNSSNTKTVGWFFYVTFTESVETQNAMQTKTQPYSNKTNGREQFFVYLHQIAMNLSWL